MNRGGRPRKTNGARKIITQSILPGASSTSSSAASSKKQKSYHHQITEGRRGRLGFRSGLHDTEAGPPPELQGQRPANEPAEDHLPIHTEIPDPKKKRPKITRADRLTQWLRFRSTYLDELMRLDGDEGLGANPRCSSCTKKNPENLDIPEGRFRCRDCFHKLRLCAECILDNHKRLPLHRIEEWTGAYFKKTTLCSLGLVVYLSHDGEPCQSRAVTSSQHRFLVCDLSGIHDVEVVFCNCYVADTGIVSQWQQLLRAGWYPATHNKPTTAFTIKLLDFFYELNHQGKSNLYDFYKTLERITDNSGTVIVPSVYRQLSDAIRQWRNLMLLKRSGRGHDPAGIDATQAGECAVECPACPHPGKNLPENWAEAPPHIAWLYVLFLMLDANFRLKLKDRGFRDVKLTSGWAYFVETSKYEAFVKAAGEQKEANTCSAEHNAIKNANNKQQGYLVSGAAACLCNRHGLVRPNGVADLEKGERYCSMDYILLASLSGTQTALLVSYDIACQYHKNFPKRNAEFPPCLRLSSPRATQIRWVIPKKHWLNHGRKGHSRFSLNYVPNVGRTYGEGIEASWAHMNPVSMSTKEMAPQSRHEVLDSHWGAWNWNKIRNLGPRFARLLRDALAMKAKHAAAFDDFSKTFSAETLHKWRNDIERWENDPTSKFDPFDDEVPGVTLNEIKLKLAQEDASDAANGIKSVHEITPSVFLQVGLEIEDQQCALLAKRRQGKRSTADRASLQRKLNALAHRLDAWRKVQAVYMPFTKTLIQARTDEGDTGELEAREEDDEGGDADIDAEADADEMDTAVPVTQPDQDPLWLPSSLPENMRADHDVSLLMRKERQLRIAQADDALADIRRLRRIMAGIGQFKMLNISGSGQKANTRARGLYEKFKGKETAAAARYRAAYAALEVLDPCGDWSQRLKPLLSRDLRGPCREDDTPLGEGRHEASWIWLTPRLSAMDGNEPTTEEFNRSMQAEWSKARARARRWDEETLLLLEEMRRVLVYFEWKANWWTDQGMRRTVAADIASGLAAYAAKQAALYWALNAKFGSEWGCLLRANGIHPDWIDVYAPTDGNQQVGSRSRRKRGVEVISDDDSSSTSGISDAESSDSD